MIMNSSWVSMIYFREWSLRRGGSYKTGGGQVKVNPYRKGGGAEKVLNMLKGGGHKKF